MKTNDWLTLALLGVTLLGILTTVVMALVAAYRRRHETITRDITSLRELSVRQDERVKALETSQPMQDREIHDIKTGMQRIELLVTTGFARLFAKFDIHGAVDETAHSDDQI